MPSPTSPADQRSWLATKCVGFLCPADRRRSSPSNASLHLSTRRSAPSSCATSCSSRYPSPSSSPAPCRAGAACPRARRTCPASARRSAHGSSACSARRLASTVRAFGPGSTDRADVHRFLHHPSRYARFHKCVSAVSAALIMRRQHHTFTAPVALAATYATMTERASRSITCADVAQTSSATSFRS